jgi:hypothetical protein
MRRILLTSITSSALILSVPSVASASHHGKSCHQVHHAKHASCATHARLVRFGAPLATGAPAGSAPASSSDPHTAGGPSSPTTAEETAGKVKSFAEGVLVITLNDGSSVSGKVTEQSEIHCQVAGSTGSDDGSDESEQSDGEGEGGSSDGSSSAGHDARAASVGPHDEADGSGDEADGSGGGQEGGSAACTTAALVPGAVVREAELRIGSSGAVWDHVDLMQ